jgi:hypothetical protein
VDERTLRTGMVYKRRSGGICQLYFSSEILQKIAGTLTMGADDANFFRNPTSQKIFLQLTSCESS